MKENIHQTNQIIGGMVAGENLYHAENLKAALERQDSAFTKAIEQIDKVRDFVGSPEHILGNNQTKHGEIAEQVEVGIRNARDYLRQQTPNATFDGVGRTAPEDYLIDDVQVQSKFINGINKNLDHVLEHMRKYENFGRDGSYYHIPEDYHETIKKVLSGESVEGLTDRTVHKIQQNVQEIEKLSGKSFDNVVKPSNSQYSEVQQGKIHDTLDSHEQELSGENKQIKENIRTDAQPNLGDMAQVAAKGALIGGGIRLAFKLYEKYKQGKNPFLGDYTVEDWKELGIDTAKGATIGGITATSIYALTNYAGLSAPFAASFVSASQSIASLVKSFNSGEISFEQFTEMSQLVCIESAAVGLASALGQAVIPIPVLGAILGTIAGRIAINFTKKYFAEKSESLKNRMEKYYNKCLAEIDRTYQEVVSKIITEYEKLGDLTKSAFDTSKNVVLRLQASIELSEAYGVSDAKIIHNINELDAFMLS
ncbi:MAG: hypothetical protein HC903_04330 [Methylacidiphilales bacterium]|nr:hypothetical protein [Candidatus Methylacidiphilales bacterium]